MAKKKSSSGDKWIQKAIKNPGALRKQAAKERALTKQGVISKDWLQNKAKGSSTTAKRARFALTLGKLRKKK